jgi:hypothetical protein
MLAPAGDYLIAFGLPLRNALPVSSTWQHYSLQMWDGAAQSN